MPQAMLGGIGNGLGSALGGLFGSGPTSTTTIGNTSANSNTSASQNSNTNSGNQGGATTTPNLPAWYNSFLQNLPVQYAQQFFNASQPVVGPAQQANYTQQVGQQYGNQLQQLQSQLAKSGALDSGRAASAQTGLALGKLQNLSNYNAQVPFQNAQFNQQYGNQLLGQGMGFTSPISAYGSTSTNFNNAFQNYFGSNASNSNSNTATNQTQKNSGSGLFGALGI